jgi:hypothetical protein
METIIIGFGYKARHGKDTAVKAIVEARAELYDVRRYAFADELKREASQLDQYEWCLRHGIPYDENPAMDDPLCQTKDGKQRAFLQWYGTEYRRAKDPYYWVKRLAARIAAEKPQVALISDMRFKNEFFWVKSQDGYTVKVSRHGYHDSSMNNAHPSEVDLDGIDFDYEITCLDGEVDQLRKDAVTVFDMIVAAQAVPDIDFSVPVAAENK